MGENTAIIKIVAAIKRHAAIPLLVICLLLLLFTLTGLYGAKDKATFKAEHQWGDPAVLDDVTISGQLLDGYHNASFAWKGSDVFVKTRLNAIAEQPNFYRYSHGGEKKIGNFRYMVYNYEYSYKLGYEVTEREFSGNKQVSNNRAIAVIPLEFSAIDKSQSPYMNSNEYGIAKIEDDVFFTVTTTRAYHGQNGIYKLSFSDDYSNDKPVSEPITTFSLDLNKDEQSMGIEVLGLEAVGDKLALILVKEGKLVVEGYNLDGSLIGSASVEPFALNGWGHSTPSAESVSERYEAFANKGEQTLTLSFRRDALQRKAVTFSFAQSVELTDVTDMTIGSDLFIEDRILGLQYMTYKSGKMYVVSSLQELEEESHRDTFYATIAPRRLLVQVYEKGKLVYKGELITDINDDLIRLKNINASSIGYSTIDNRNFYEFHIE